MKSMEEFAGIYMATGTLMGDTLSVYKKDGTAMFFVSGYGLLIAANSGTYRLENDRVIAAVIPLIRLGGEVNEIEGVLEDFSGIEMIFHDNSGTRANDVFEFLVSRDLSLFEDMDFTKFDGRTEVDKINFGKNSSEICLGKEGRLQDALADFVRGCINLNKEDIKEKSERAKTEKKARKTENEPAPASGVVNVFGSGREPPSGTPCGLSDGQPEETSDKNQNNVSGGNELTEKQVIAGATAAAGVVASALFGKRGLANVASIDRSAVYPYGFGFEFRFYIKEFSSEYDFKLFFTAENGNVKKVLIAVAEIGKTGYDDWTKLLAKLGNAVGRINYFCFMGGSSPRFPAEELFKTVLPNVKYCSNIGEIPYDEPFKIESIHACQDVFRGIKTKLINVETIQSCLESLAEQVTELAPDCEVYEL